jgi:hypothetical protein
MAIDMNQIQTPITLAIDERVITIADFQKAADSFFNLIKEMTYPIEHIKSAEVWEVKVYPGSAAIGLYPTVAFIKIGETVMDNLIEGLEKIEQGARPSNFTDKAIEHIRDLASSFKKNLTPNLRIWRGKNRSILLDRKIVTVANEFLSFTYEEEGAIDGKIEKLNVHNSKNFTIYDVISNMPVSCEMADNLLDDVIKNFGKRVEVIGKVKYKRDGTPISIKAKKLAFFPAPHEIPSIEKMRWLLQGAPL